MQKSKYDNYYSIKSGNASGAYVLVGEAANKLARG